ncbi:MAG: glycoside hydrolase family 30 protein [Chromatiaceae bacterium]|jgi:glucosylceramidase
MHNFVKPRLAVAAVLALCSQFFANPVLASTDSSKVPQLLLTSANQQYLLAENPAGLLLPAAQSGAATIVLNTRSQYQPIDGFGFSLTGGSAQHLMQLQPARRAALLQELFSAKGINISYLRISLGASDLDEKPFSYNDLPAGQQDPALKHFSLKPDEKTLIPALKEILALKPNLKILASPWSPPVWMKSNQSTVGGELLEQHFASYAQYFVRYIQGMAAHGIRIDAVTIQNEPLHDGNNPSLLMHAWDQAAFIKHHLGPAFKAAGITSKIIIYDHNADHVEYPITVLNDPAAKAYIDGSAFHLYNGDISELAKLKAAHPDKQIYFTEQWVGADSDFAGSLQWHTEHLIIGATRQWARNVLEWNLAADSQYRPFTDGGCSKCLGALTIDGQQLRRNVAYYIIGQASKWLLDGSVRIDSGANNGPLKQVALLRPDGRILLLVLNNSAENLPFNLRRDGKSLPFSVTAPAHSVLTLLL